MTWEGRKKRPSKKAGADAAEKPEPLTRQKLELLALSYINRFDCTASKLTRHLNERVRKLGGHDDAALWISELVQRYQGSGVLDDARFAKNLSSQLSSRGKSARAISQKLSMRGVPSEIASELMTARKQDEPNAELDAARTYARKRRLGQHRDAATRAENHQKDLAALARQGFSFDVARKALGPGPGSDEEF